MGKKRGAPGGVSPMRACDPKFLVVLPVVAAVVLAGIIYDVQPASPHVSPVIAPRQPVTRPAYRTSAERRLNEELQEEKLEELSTLLRSLCENVIFQTEVWEQQPVHLDSVEVLRHYLNHTQVTQARLLISNDNWFTISGFKEGNASVQDGTVVSDAVLMEQLDADQVFAIHGAALQLEAVASASVEVMAAIQMPVSTTVHISESRSRTVLPPRNYAQDQIILQTQGTKRWTLLQAPADLQLPSTDQLIGHNGIEADYEELGPPLHYTLQSGSLLYIPRGYVYSSSAEPSQGGLDGESNSKEFSVHLAVSIETLALQATMADALRCAALFSLPKKGGAHEQVCSSGGAIDVARKSDIRLRKALPLGFLYADTQQIIQNLTHLMGTLRVSNKTVSLSHTVKHLLHIGKTEFDDALRLIQRQHVQTLREFMELYLPEDYHTFDQRKHLPALKRINDVRHDHAKRVLGHCGVGMDVSFPNHM